MCPPGSTLVTPPGECCATCSPVTTSAWTPKELGKQLVFWFDPTSLTPTSAGEVMAWIDLSSNGNHATPPTSDYAPAYDASGIDGLPSALFSGPITFLDILDSPTLEWGTDDFAVFAVVRATSETAPDAMIYQKTGPPPYDGPSLYLNTTKPVELPFAAAQVSGAVYVVSVAPPATYLDGVAHVLGARRAGATLEIRVDGAVSNSITSPDVASVDVSAPGLDAIIGQNGYGVPSPEFQQLHGDVAELIGVHGTFADADVAMLERYLMSRYGIL